MARIDAFLKLGLAQGCSDIHLAVGIPPMLRLHGDLMPIKFRDLGDTELEGYVDEILSDSQRERFRRKNDIDFSYVSSDGGRFRVNVFHKATGVGATFRNIPSVVPSLDSLGLPPILHKFCDLHQGMVLVTGSTGTGKSTTLAAMIDHINTTSNSNIISLEDPIEFVHSSKRSQIIQRELGTHIPSFAEGVRASLARRPRRHPRRRAARRRDDQHGHDGRRDRALGARHAAHDERRQVDRPHHRRPTRRSTRADEELPRRTACTPS